MLIDRKIDINAIRQLIGESRVTAILGPRQSGKTTIAKQFSANYYFDLENPQDLSQFDNPQLTLERCRGLIVIDEIQRKPDLFSLLRYLVDTIPDQRYLILGSASRDLIKQGSESLAGRISFHTLMGFRREDLKIEELSTLWYRGGLPPAFLASNDKASNRWRQNYIQTFLERDIPNLGIRIPATTLRRFWSMIAHYHGNIVNFSEIGRSFGISDTTVHHYFEILTGTFMLRMMQPWFENLGKRLVKRPKVFFRDTGLLHSLFAIEKREALFQHPKLSSSWEGFALDCCWRSIGKPDDMAYFWSTHSGAEVDLFWQHNGENWACEFRYADAPKFTKSMRSVLADLNLKKLWIVYPGSKTYYLHEKVIVIPLGEIPSEWEYE